MSFEIWGGGVGEGRKEGNSGVLIDGYGVSCAERTRGVWFCFGFGRLR